MNRFRFRFSENTNVVLTPFDYNGSNCDGTYKVMLRSIPNNKCHYGHYVINFKAKHWYTYYPITLIGDLSNLF